MHAAEILSDLFPERKCIKDTITWYIQYVPLDCDRDLCQTPFLNTICSTGLRTHPAAACPNVERLPFSVLPPCLLNSY